MHFRFLLLVLLASLLSGCGEKSPEPQAVAAEFFRQCTVGETAQAYASTADLFQLTRSQKFFEARVGELQLDQARAEWSAPEAVGKNMRVKGVFTRTAKDTLKPLPPLNLSTTLIQEKGRWRVLEVREDRADAKHGGDDIFEAGIHNKDMAQQKGSITEMVTATVPTDKQLTEMVDKVMTDFNNAIQRNDFTEFFNSTAERWRFRGKSPEVINDPQRSEASDPENRDERLTLTKIRAEFQRFVDQKVDLSSLLGKKIVFSSKPVLSTEGVLSLEGHYEDYFFRGVQAGGVAEPFMLSFKVEFFYEYAGWKLFGFHPHIHSAKDLNK